MRSVTVHGPEDVRVDDVDEPRCGPRDVLVAMKACGVCGTDLTYVQLGGLPTPGARCPMPLGHEPAGEVVEVGAEVRGVEAGMRVVFNPVYDEMDPIGNGGSQGALSDLVAVRDAHLGANMFEIPADVPYEVAALTEPLSVALHAVNRADPRPGQTAVVFGAGPVGAGIVAWLSLRGIGDVVSVDLSPSRLQQATTLGADAVVDGASDVVEALRERHGTDHVLGAPVAATDIWIDAAGSQTVIDTILRGSRQEATAVVVAVYKAAVQFDLVAFLTKELRFTSSLAYPSEFPDVAAAMATHWERFAPMVTDRVPFADAPAALGRAAAPDVLGKVMVGF